jgi:hypothetical protein
MACQPLSPEFIASAALKLAVWGLGALGVSLWKLTPRLRTAAGVGNTSLRRGLVANDEYIVRTVLGCGAKPSVV